MFERGSEEFVFFTDFWNIAKKYWIAREDDEYWENFLRDAEIFNQKYKSIGLARILMSGLVQWFDEQLKERRKNE